MFKKVLPLATVSLMMLSLSACSTPNNAPKNTPKKAISSLQSQAEPKQDPQVRLNFDNITTATVEDNFKGGSTLDDIKAIYGEPTSYETKPAGDVTLDVYVWKIDDVTINAQLFEDSTIAKSISNFAFDRKATITKAIFDDKLSNDLTFSQATDILGFPDVMSQSVSSDGEHIQALWSSNLKGNQKGKQIELNFKNGILSNKTQHGLKE